MATHFKDFFPLPKLGDMQVCSSLFIRHLHLTILGMFKHGILFQFFPFWLGVIYRLQHGFVQLQISTRNGALFTPFPGSTKCDAWYWVQATMDHFVEMYDVGFQRRQLSVGFLFLFAAIWFIIKCADKKTGKFNSCCSQNGCLLLSTRRCFHFNSEENIIYKKWCCLLTYI